MINLLLVGAVEKNFSSKIIQKAVDEIKPDKCVLLVHEKREKECFEKFGKCYFREDIVKGLYSDSDLDMKNCEPLDDSVFQYMAPYHLEILNQQRRFEEYHDFHVPATLESHYTIYMHNLFFWNNLLKKEKITHAFLACIPHEGYDSIIYHLCKKYGIPVLMVYDTFFPTRQYALTDYLEPQREAGAELQKLSQAYAGRSTEEIVLAGEALRMYEKWSSTAPEKMRPWYMEGNPLERRLYNRLGETSIFEACKSVLSGIYKKYDYSFCMQFVGDCFGNIPSFAHAAKETLKRRNYARKIKKRTFELNDYYESLAQLPEEGEQYIYFALHYQPEASSNPLGGGEYFDQMFAVNILSQSLPEHFKIYVKVHPEQLASLRSREYYDDLKKIDKVKLIGQKCDTYSLIKGAFAVSSLTGTVCWEAQFFGVPALVFGYSHKNLAPLSYPVRTVEDCKEAVGLIEKMQREVPYRQLKLLIKAVYNISFEVDDREKIFPQLIRKLVSGSDGE